MPHVLPFLLTDHIALVTGASRGLGLEIALGLARAGAHILVNCRDAGRTGEVAARIVEEGGSAEALPFDVGDEDAGNRAFDDIGRRFGRLDIFVHNVGMRLRAPLDRISTVDFNHMLAVDLTAAFTLTKRAGALMVANGYGRIVFVTSISGTLGGRNDAAYIAAKAGLTGLMRAFACEFGAAGVTCNAIAPGPFATESNADISAERLERVRQRVALGRRGDPAEIAGPAVFLASQAASYVNGHVLTVDGGYSVTS
ncbi:MAG: gluconate 5-dehydrogenase [Rhodospirillales bacterium]|nr:gluconate 5-dehydrogenase [Rhodospirillales bacterium]